MKCKLTLFFFLELDIIPILRKVRDNQMNQIKVFMKENEQQFVLFGMIVAALAVILLGILVWKLPVIPVCLIFVLEAGMTVCMQRVPIWAHGVMIAAQIILGALVGAVLFLLTCAVFYVMGILALGFSRK